MDTDNDNKFPRFKDGDVAIHLSLTDQFQLHSQVLKQNSTFFDEELREPGAKLTAKARRDGHAAYRFDLVRDPQDIVGRFVRRDVTEHGKVKGSAFTLSTTSSANNLSDILASPSSTTTTTSTSRHWTLLFAFFYGTQPAFREDNVAALLTDCDTFMTVAGSIGSESRGVREVVDLALLRNDKTIWGSVATNPRVWAGLARKIHSPTIYKEAVVHLVGNWKGVVEAGERGLVEGELREVVERKVAELEIVKEAVELRILGHYPEKVVRERVRVGGGKKMGRGAYSGDIYRWMALCLYRQWFAQGIEEDRARRAEDGGCAFYRLLADGGEAYLGKGDLGEFYQYFPMSAKGEGMLVGCLRELKEDIKAFVEGLMVNRSHLPDRAVGWLTCAKIEKEDLPWEWEVVEDGEDELGQLMSAHMEVEYSDMEMEDDEAGPSGVNDGDGVKKGKGKAQTSIRSWVQGANSAAGPSVEGEGGNDAPAAEVVVVDE